ncbi:hypothetical protein [Brachyspira hampsonii]|uniref:hypothetical protein n=1 Tax=Brachyspira hampsonii TaxID=1287055 RepID=UPI001CA557E2|nr:hypothetical protein [Brachyspira hampsonii]MBW5389919.1 hypothetical protein [Brachyspira hampsonii]
MIKKLFLFTLLVSSFLVISCSNKDTTGATGTGIDSKYDGTYYYGTSERIVVANGGTTSYTYGNYSTTVLTVSKEKYYKLSYNSFKTTVAGVEEILTFTDSSLTVSVLGKELFYIKQ